MRSKCWREQGLRHSVQAEPVTLTIHGEPTEVTPFMHELKGGCHCGNISVTYTTSIAPDRSDILVLANSVYLILFNLLPLIWIVRFQHVTDVTAAPATPGMTLLPDLVTDYGITPREEEVLELACAGKTNQEIADRLFISVQTVKDHVYSIYRKTKVRNRVELANLVYRRTTSPDS